MKQIFKLLTSRILIAPLLIAAFSFDLILIALTCDLTKSDWAAWVQAVGSIAAIVGTCAVAAWQYDRNREDDLARRQRDVTDIRDAEVAARALAVRNMVQIATFALDNALGLVEHLKENRPVWQADGYYARIEHLRAVLDSSITPMTDHLAVVSALGISQILVQTHAEIGEVRTMLPGDLLARCETRVREGYDRLGSLIDLQIKLDEICRARGIATNIETYRPGP